MLKLLAFDYGASSGRAILGKFNGEKLQISEVHRFPNDPVIINGSLYWDILRLFHELKQGIMKGTVEADSDIAGIGIDTWGVDFGLLDSKGDLLSNPYHYRDNRTQGMIDIAASRVSREDIYMTTGIAFLKFNTIYQLLSLKENNYPALDKAQTALFIPDLLNYFLTGVKLSEYTIASTSQMVSVKSRNWARDMLEKIGIKDSILTDICHPGKIIGNLKADIATELKIKSIPVIAVAEHDTASAVVAVPATNKNFSYLSSGTWSLLGSESGVPVANQTSYRLNYTNEGGIDNTFRILKNIMGLWILQECKREWDKQGEVLDFGELVNLAGKAKPFSALIDPDNNLFYDRDRMPEKILEFCKRTNQKIPENKGALVRCILESLALKYRMALEELEEVMGCSFTAIHIVGGGSQNKMLNQFTANSTGSVVVAGPVEATAIGNLIVQLIALGEIENLSQGRMLVRNSFSIQEYLPEETEKWNQAYHKFKELNNIL